MIPIFPFLIFAAQIGGDYERTAQAAGENGDAQFGRSVAFIGDWNGDGTNDYAVGAPGEEFAGLGALGSVRIYSGVDDSLLEILPGPVADGNFGFTITNPGDLDGDGNEDLLVAAVGFFTFSPVSTVTAYSSTTGTPIHQVSDGLSDSQFGIYMKGVGDLDVDGTPDYVVGAVATNNYFGAAYVYSGRTGTLIRSHARTNQGGLYGRPTALGDLNSDGIPDYSLSESGISLSGVGDNGRLLVQDGATGALLYSVGGQPEEGLGFSTISIGDLDGDGKPEFAVRHKVPGGGTWATYALRICSGADGTEIQDIASDQIYDGLGFYMATAPDLDGDGFRDFMASAELRKNQLGVRVGGVLVISSATGELIKTIFGDASYQNFGYTVDVLEELDPTRTSILIGGPGSTALQANGTGEVFAYTYRSFLESDANSLSASAGGQIHFILDFPQDNGGDSYLLLASGGTGPVGVGGVAIPLTSDSLLATSLGAGIPMMQNGSGTLDGNGDATADWVVAPGAMQGFVGRTVHFAAVSLSGAPTASSAESAVTILP